jgi:hypothetical protein
MATAQPSREQTDDPDSLRDEWLGHLAELVNTVNGWAVELGWSTRQISKKMKESPLGSFEAPALLLQRETVRVLLDPVARFVPGADGVVDLYLMPAYDDIASLYLVDGQWRLFYVYPDAGAVDKGRDAIPLSKESFGRALDDMCAHAS